MSEFTEPLAASSLQQGECFCNEHGVNEEVSSPLWKQVETIIKSESFQRAFLEQTDDCGRIRFVLSHELLCKYICYSIDELKSSCGCGGKDAIKAAKFRADGNNEFSQKKYEDALVFYNDAIRHAPEDVAGLETGNQKALEELPLAYGNRSAVYYHLGQYENALKDIVASLALGYARHKSADKLYLRKCDCLLQLGRIVDARNTLLLEIPKLKDQTSSDGKRWNELFRQVGQHPKVKVESHSSDQSDKPLNDLTWVIDTLTKKGRFQPQSKNRTLSSKVAVCYDASQGHHLVATEDIHYGDILGVTKPFVHALEIWQDKEFCHHCLTPMKSKMIISRTSRFPSNFSRCIPCGQCTRVMYCSEQCRADSWTEYHRFECAILPFLYKQRANQVTLRTIILSGGMEEIQKVVENLKDNVSDLSASTDLWCNNGLVTYEHIHRMRSRPDLYNLATEKMIEIVLFACAMMKLYKISGALFKFSECDKSKEELISSAAIIFRIFVHYGTCALVFNKSRPLKLNVVSEPANTKIFKDCEQFCTINPMITDLVKNSCYPNMSIISVDGGHGYKSNVSLFMAILAIPAGSSLTAQLPTYGGNFYFQLEIYQFSKRQKEARLEYETEIRCKCDKCKLDGRNNPFGHNEMDYYPIGCAKCGGLFVREPNCNSFRCVDCGQKQSVAQMKKAYNNMKCLDEQVDAQLRNIQFNMYDKNSINLLTQCESFVNNGIVPMLHRDAWRLAQLYEKLSEYYHDHSNIFGRNNQSVRLLDSLEAWKYAQKCLTTLERCFGVESIPVFQELNTIIDRFYVLNDCNPIRFKDVNKGGKINQEVRDMICQYHEAKKQWQKFKDFYDFV